MACLLRALLPGQHRLNRLLPFGHLQGNSIKISKTQQRIQYDFPFFRGGLRVHGDRVPVGINLFDEAGHGPALGIGLPDGRKVDRSVFLTQVPVKSQMMPKPGHQLPKVQLPHRSVVAPVEQGFVLGFLQHHLHKQPPRLHVLKDNFPLGQLAHVEAGEVVRTSVGPHVFAVAPDVHRQKVDRVHALGDQVVHTADQPFAPTVSPDWVTGLPVVDVGLISMDGRRGGSVFLLVGSFQAVGVVEIFVGQQVFGTVGSALDPVVAVLEPEITVVSREPPASCESPTGIIGRPDAEFARSVFNRNRFSGG